MPGHHNAACGAQHATQPISYLDAVKFWHLQIEQADIGLKFFCHDDGLRTVGAFCYYFDVIF
jgi:hypothetical protein